MFGKRISGSGASVLDDRRESARREPLAVSARLDGQPVVVLDMSEAGVRLSLASPPRVAILEIFERGRLVSKTSAMLCWSRKGEAGYAFRHHLGVCDLPERASRGRVGASGAGGTALRARLGLG